MTDETTTTSMISNKLYDVLKMVVQIVLPALGTLYFTLSAIWGLPYAEQVVGTLAAVATFLGVFLGLSSRSYNNSDSKYDGDLVPVVNPETGTTVYTLELNSDPADLGEKKQVAFKVLPPPLPPK